jgi:hypothetical protein
MKTRKFATWLAIYREHFPNGNLLRRVGITWYPGRRRVVHEAQLAKIQTIGKVEDYWLTLSNWSLDDRRPRVCVQRDSEAYFWIDPIEVDSCYGVDDTEQQRIQEILSLYATDIRHCWSEFKTFGATAQAKFASELLQSQS